EEEHEESGGEQPAYCERNPVPAVVSHYEDASCWLIRARPALPPARTRGEEKITGGAPREPVAPGVAGRGPGERRSLAPAVDLHIMLAKRGAPHRHCMDT